MKVIYETCTGEFQEDEIISIEEGERIARGSETWRIEDEDGEIIEENK